MNQPVVFIDEHAAVPHLTAISFSKEERAYLKGMFRFLYNGIKTSDEKNAAVCAFLSGKVDTDASYTTPEIKFIKMAVDGATKRLEVALNVEQDLAKRVKAQAILAIYNKAVDRLTAALGEDNGIRK